MKLLFTALTTSLALSYAASGAITLVDSGGIAKTGNSTGTYTVTAAEIDNFNANGTDKLVVTFSGERNGASPYSHSGVTYGGQAMTLIERGSTDNSARYLSMWYLDNVSVTGNFVVTFEGGTGSGSGIGISAVALNGTAAGFVDSNFSSTGTSTSITTTAAGQFVLAAGMSNNAPAIGASSPLTQLYAGDTGSSVGAAGYQFVATAGAVSPTFANANGVTAAAFAAVPEPSAAMLGLFGVALILLRRRRSQSWS